MCLWNRPSAFGARKVLRAVLAASLLLGGLSSMAFGQATSPNMSGPSGEFYGGIEINAESVKAVALRVSQSEEESGLKLAYSEVIRLALWRTGGGDFAPQASEEAAQAVMKLLSR